MGALKVWLLVGAVVFALLAVIHEYDPALLAFLYQIPGVKEWAQKAHFYMTFRYTYNFDLDASVSNSFQSAMWKGLFALLLVAPATGA
jgi:hypothetical protein